jgi:hypothetical protein
MVEIYGAAYTPKDHSNWSNSCKIELNELKILFPCFTFSNDLAFSLVIDNNGQYYI